MTDTLERPEISEHDLKALDFAVECEEPGCGTPATRWVVCRACNAHMGLCRKHAFDVVVFCSTHDDARCRRGCVMTCERCHEHVTPRRWRVLFEIIPIEST